MGNKLADSIFVDFLGAVAKAKNKPSIQTKTVWTIVIDAGVNCPSCDEEMETVFRFYPKHRRVGSYTRRELQHQSFDYWLDHASLVEDVCPGCGYQLEKSVRK